MRRPQARRKAAQKRAHFPHRSLRGSAAAEDQRIAAASVWRAPGIVRTRKRRQKDAFSFGGRGSPAEALRSFPRRRATTDRRSGIADAAACCGGAPGDLLAAGAGADPFGRAGRRSGGEGSLRRRRQFSSAGAMPRAASASFAARVSPFPIPPRGEAGSSRPGTVWNRKIRAGAQRCCAPALLRCSKLLRCPKSGGKRRVKNRRKPLGRESGFSMRRDLQRNFLRAYKAGESSFPRLFFA